jgi:RNA polymerase sigma factor (sigma-70 family)
VDLIDEFEVARPRLRSLAHRILGSLEDADDAVQTAWLRAQAAEQTGIGNPAGWFTTVTARLCLDQLRSRERRGELPLLADAIPGDQLAADEEYLRREDVSRALLVLLSRLTAIQRVAYVLHDLFRVPFAEVAVVLDTTPTNAKKLASRARRVGGRRGHVVTTVKWVAALRASARKRSGNAMLWKTDARTWAPTAHR